jgi:tRNA uridine 5-carbamoylmethylation protein Kti12
MTPVLLLTGPPGAGKTTTARVLAERSDRAAHIESDLFFGFIASGYVEPWKRESHGQNEVVMRAVAETAATYAAAGYFTIVDGIILPAWFLRPIADELGRAGQSVAYVVLRAPLDECVERVRNREGLLGEPGVVERLWNDFSDLGELEAHAVEVNEGSPEDAADRIEEGLRAGNWRLGRI